VKQFIQTLQPLGFKIWIDLHYSDTWADPGHQEPPKQWQGISFIALKDSVYNYTAQVVSKLNPDYIQIGNEINNGFLHPYGHISTNLRQFITLIDTAILAVRNSTEKTQIMLHYAGTNGAKWFFNQVADSDYDMIGLSYYPWWHGKSLSHLKAIMQQLNAAHNKSVIIAETSYPFTLGWNDWTHNTVGMEDQLILPDFPATPDGQQNFVHQIKLITREVNGGGFCYWGAELIAWKGNQATDGSPRENMALFDFDNKAVPALKEFRTDK
jgi:arabinogalactan endo-1,4-beta-galactosidase